METSNSDIPEEASNLKSTAHIPLVIGDLDSVIRLPQSISNPLSPLSPESSELEISLPLELNSDPPNAPAVIVNPSSPDPSNSFSDVSVENSNPILAMLMRQGLEVSKK